MQFGDPDHAALVGGNEARQQIGEADFLGFHRVAAGGEFEAGFGELADMFGKIGVCLGGMEGPQRLAVNDQRDSDLVRSADAIEMVLDVADHKTDLVEIASQNTSPNGSLCDGITKTSAAASSSSMSSRRPSEADVVADVELGGEPEEFLGVRRPGDVGADDQQPDVGSS